MKRILLIIGLVFSGAVFAENVDPYETGAQYGWAENVGWLNAEPDVGGGMQVEGDKVTGWIWGENIGWINLHCLNNGTCATVNFGLVNDGAGNLSGYAWAENVGWLNFDPVVTGPGDAYQVTVDADGKMSGWAWGENIGWIHFDNLEKWSGQFCRRLAEGRLTAGQPGPDRRCGHD
jgi:hypothetical protein